MHGFVAALLHVRVVQSGVRVGLEIHETTQAALHILLVGNLGLEVRFFERACRYTQHK